ncbi:hypothetical protein MBRA1_003222 [Malassezia brasiliensis]|uniref:Sds3-like protein n=1 Tax=Malassezia brasiliensis TaxID=1821822 RepID=A0AAF0DVK1_9BASI|nr:hypothetical protein MBRA1_003222 [Malassezia brasiliensis]
MEQAAPLEEPPQVQGPGAPPAPPLANDGFSEGSELTEEGESDADRTVQPSRSREAAMSDEENSTLSDDASDKEPSTHNEAPNALEGLASVASTTANLEQEAPNAIVAATVSSPLSSDEEDESGETTVETPATPRKGRSTLRRAVIAAAGKRRAAATGGAPSLLVEPDPDSSAPPSAATSRQNSPESELGERAHDSDAEMEAHGGDEVKDEPDEVEVPGNQGAVDEAPGEDAGDEAAGEGAAGEQDAEEKETGTPAAEGTEQDDVEAMQRRQEAVDLLTRIEIAYAMLRDRLYHERLEELEAESEMIHDGTHPELQLLHMIIDARRDRRLALLQNWLSEEELERARWAKAEDAIAWVNWRDDAASVRRDLISDTVRKRRRLDREKRLLDTPQPIRRHQPFEAELVRKPPAYSARSQRDVDRYDYALQRYPNEDIHAYMAYPDLRGLDEYDVWMDMDQMGIRPMAPMYPPYVRQDEVAMQEMYPPYAPPQPAGYGPSYPVAPGYMERGYEAPVPLEERGMPPEYDVPPYAKGYGEAYVDPARFPGGMPYLPPRAPMPS